MERKIARAQYQHVRLLTDGGANRNPGPGTWGFIIRDPATNTIIAKRTRELVHTTNIAAEYRALIEGLRKCLEYTTGRVDHVSGCELVVKQMSGVWNVKDPEMRRLNLGAFSEVKNFEKVTHQWVGRDHPGIFEVDNLIKAATRE